MGGYGRRFFPRFMCRFDSISLTDKNLCCARPEAFESICGEESGTGTSWFVVCFTQLLIGLKYYQIGSVGSL